MFEKSFKFYTYMLYILDILRKSMSKSNRMALL